MIDAAEYLQSRGVRDIAAIEASGATVEDGRVWLPWRDVQGQEVYRTGRSLNGAQPRYKNAKGPRPPLYATAGAWDSPEITLVEGPIDALAVFSATGIPAFATAGSSLSDDAVRILSGKQTVIFIPDAANGERLLEQVTSRLSGRTRLKISRVPDGFGDVADLAAKTDDESVAEVLVGAVPMIPRRGVVPGGTFALDFPTDEPAVWGRGDEVLLSPGEPTMIVGPQGVGKTTLGQRLALARIGIDTDLLGFRVVVSTKPVLYLAADRPRQAQRSLRRMVTEVDRERLDTLLKVHRGPLGFDIGREPERLVEFVLGLEAGTVVIDALKDLAVDLSRDETGSRVGRALALVVAEGIEMLVLHHQRKASAENRKPKTLDDVYGSAWLTAGCGSVILLWGRPGDPVVELSHLKQPMGEVGPLQVMIDHHHGAVSVAETPDAVVLLQTSEGLTAREGAVRLFGAMDPRPADIEKTRRKFEALVKRGLAYRKTGDRQARLPDTYFAMPLRGAQECLG